MAAPFCHLNRNRPGRTRHVTLALDHNDPIRSPDLNPFGFTLLASLFGYASAGLIAGVILLGGGLLVFLGLIEWLTRTEIANARLQRAHEDRDGNA